MTYNFLSRLGKIGNKKESQSVILYGNVYDLFFDGEQYVSLLSFLKNKWNIPGYIQVVYEVNQPIRFSNEFKVKSTWELWRESQGKEDNNFKKRCTDSINHTALGLEFIRQLTICSKEMGLKLIVIIEGIDMLLPNDNLSNLSEADRTRIRIIHSWFSDPSFQAGDDLVVLISESKHEIHPKVSRLPQVLSVEIPAADFLQRYHFLKTIDFGDDLSISKLANQTAGLSIQSLRQLIVSGDTSLNKITEKVKEYIISQLGEGVVDFERPRHSLNDVVGFTRLKKFLKEELIPRFQATDDSAISGIAVSGPIGSGKTFIFQALSAELDCPVLTLKNMRSKWFGETDAIFEKLRRLLVSLHKVTIFVDEADTQFGGVDSNTHDTERRLTGKLQNMMGDSDLKGKVHWILMTARINQLSPDLRRPGRAGDLIIPVLDPNHVERKEFLKWAVEPVLEETEDLFNEHNTSDLEEATKRYSAAAYASLRSELKAKFVNKKATPDDVKKVIQDIIPADISETRRYQTLQALLNCTRRSLIPEYELRGSEIYEARRTWRADLRILESKGLK